MALLNCNKYRKNSGFTLIEVLIALLIIGIALAAIIKASDDNARNLVRLKDYTIAHWIGIDVITNIQLGQLAAPGTDDISPNEGTITMLEHEWHFTVTAEPTKMKGTDLLTVKVNRTSDSPPEITEYGFYNEKK